MNIIHKYLKLRLEHPESKFSDNVRDRINGVNSEMFNVFHPFLMGGRSPVKEFDSKGISDEMAIELWNLIFSREYHVSEVSDFKSVAKRYIDDSDKERPHGYGSNEQELIRYVTAQAASSFHGIQKPQKSKFSYKSMVKTLKSHANPTIADKPWFLNNISDYRDMLIKNPYIMKRDYGDLCMNAKVSSASVKGYSDYREFIFKNTMLDILSTMDSIPHEIYAGIRIDRRGKYRLICSFHAVIRAIDFLLGNHSYQAFEEDGYYSQYSTEGYNNIKLWPEMAKMTKRGDFVLVCIDYAGYDTQISMKEYIDFIKYINPVLSHDRSKMLETFESWMLQPKPLLTKEGDVKHVLIPLYKTLASGLHATHSIENFMGVSCMIQARKDGIRVNKFWTNGDDQNTLIHSDDVDNYISFLNDYFIVSWDKSLIGHRLCVWSKLWFASDFHPAWEIGVFRSIWEREGGSVSMVEESKFQSNYCKIVQTIITLIRASVSGEDILKWTKKICSECNPPIDPFRIPKQLTNFNIITSRNKLDYTPKGLKSAEYELKSKTFDLMMFGVSDYYNLLRSMFINRSIFTFDITEVEYHDEGTRLRFERSYDYSINPSNNVPFMFSKLVNANTTVTQERRFIMDILQGTKSYEGPVSQELQFTNIIELAIALNRRNYLVWVNITNRVQ